MPSDLPRATGNYDCLMWVLGIKFWSPGGTPARHITEAEGKGGRFLFWKLGHKEVGGWLGKVMFDLGLRICIGVCPLARITVLFWSVSKHVPGSCDRGRMLGPQAGCYFIANKSRKSFKLKSDRAKLLFHFLSCPLELRGPRHIQKLVHGRL